MCGQYPGAVPAAATVSLQCNGTNLPPARYVIVQFPLTGAFNFCELDVCANGILSLHFFSTVFYVWSDYCNLDARFFLPAFTIITFLRFLYFASLTPESDVFESHLVLCGALKQDYDEVCSPFRQYNAV